MADGEESRIKDMEAATKFMLKFLRREGRDVHHLLSDEKSELKHAQHHDARREKQDIEHVEQDIYKFLYDNIRVMNALIRVEKDEDYVEEHKHVNNPYKAKIAREIGVLRQELARVGVLDKRAG